MTENLYKKKMRVNDILRVEWLCCVICPESAAQPLPNIIGLNGQILIAGNITEESAEEFSEGIGLAGLIRWGFLSTK